MNPSLRADLLLLIAAAIWGFAFVAQRVGMDHVGPFTFNGVRFVLGVLSLAPLLYFRRKKGASSESSSLITYSLVLGLFLFAGSTFQQTGLIYTTAGNGGFITGLYVVFVPFLGLAVGEATQRAHWTGAILAVVGLYFLCITDEWTMSRGDLLILIGAVFWAGHVLVVARFSRHVDPVALAAGQFAVCAVLSLGSALIWETIEITQIQAAWLPLVYAGCFSAGIAYTLQVVAQRQAPPAHAAIILSLEGLFAAVGGWFLLGESLTGWGIFGCILMLAGMLVSQAGLIRRSLEPRPKTRSPI